MKKRLEKKLQKKAFERFYNEFLELAIARRQEIVMAYNDYDDEYDFDLELKIEQIDESYNERFAWIEYEVEKAGLAKYIGEMYNNAREEAKELIK